MHLKEVIKVAAGSWPAGLHGKHKEVEGGFPRGPVAKTLASSARGPGSMPGQGTRSHMPQLTVNMLRLRKINNRYKKNDTEKKMTLCYTSCLHCIHHPCAPFSWPPTSAPTDNAL